MSAARLTRLGSVPVGAAAEKYVTERSRQTWRETVTQWRVWLYLAVCLLVATIAALLGYD